MKAKIDFASQYQMQQICFYPKQPVCWSDEFTEQVLSHGRPVSMAQIQGYFMMHKLEPRAAIDHVDQLWTL